MGGKVKKQHTEPMGWKQLKELCFLEFISLIIGISILSALYTFGFCLFPTIKNSSFGYLDFWVWYYLCSLNNMEKETREEKSHVRVSLDILLNEHCGNICRLSILSLKLHPFSIWEFVWMPRKYPMWQVMG